MHLHTDFSSDLVILYFKPSVKLTILSVLKLLVCSESNNSKIIRPAFIYEMCNEKKASTHYFYICFVQ